jgi:ketosteroid isomerase-like protein
VSQENVDLVRSIIAAHERGDYANSEWADPDIEYVIADGPDAGVWRGRAGMAKAWGGVLSAYHDYQTIHDEVRELDDDRVLVLGSYSARGKATELRMSGMNAALWEMRNGRVVRHVIYFDRANALADLGLEE